MYVNKAGMDPVLGQGVRKQIKGAAVYGFLCNDVTAVCPKGFYCIADGCSAGCQSQSCASAFKGRDPFLKNVLGGIGQPAYILYRLLIFQKSNDKMFRLCYNLNIVKSAIIERKEVLNGKVC